jgi:hypothetical protein
MAADIDAHAITEFTTGACGYLAVALHDVTGWSIMAELERDDEIAHIWVVNDHGDAVDINGVHDGGWAATKYSGAAPGRIASLPREEAIGPARPDFVEWAEALVRDNVEHFGLQAFTPCRYR